MLWSLAIVFIVFAANSIHAAPKLSYGQYPKYGTYGEIGAIERQQLRSLENGFELAKRYQGKFDTGSEKHRRGPLNNLLPGGGFGRAARSNPFRTVGETNLLPGGTFGRSSRNNLIRYNPFDVESKDSSDGQLVKAFIERTSQEADYFPQNQYKEDVE